MKKTLRERPWILIVALLAIFVAANAAVLIAAQSSHGPDLLDRVPSPK